MSHPGTVYLLHFDSPISHSQHYIGWAKGDDPTDRINAHLAGTGARLLAAVVAAGNCAELVRTWVGDRKLERLLKNRKNARGLCPTCAEGYKKRMAKDAQRRRAAA